MIICDERERRSEIPALLESMNEKIEIQTLIDGDYIFKEDGKKDVFITRKSIKDFFGSRNSGHLSDEIFRLLTKYPDNIIFMILEKNQFNTREEMQISSQSYKSLQFYLPVIKTQNQRDTAETLIYYHKKFLNDSIQYFRRRIVLLDNTNNVVRLYQAFPHIAQKTAEEIYKIYPIPIDFFNEVYRTYKFDKSVYKTKKNWKENRWDKNIKFIGEKKNKVIGDILFGKEDDENE